AEPPAGVTEIEAGAILVFDVPFPRGGTYRFEITIDGAQKAAVPVTVSQLPSGSGPPERKAASLSRCSFSRRPQPSAGTLTGTACSTPTRGSAPRWRA